MAPPIEISRTLLVVLMLMWAASLFLSFWFGKFVGGLEAELEMDERIRRKGLGDKQDPEDS